MLMLKTILYLSLCFLHRDHLAALVKSRSRTSFSYGCLLPCVPTLLPPICSCPDSLCAIFAKGYGRNAIYHNYTHFLYSGNFLCIHRFSSVFCSSLPLEPTELCPQALFINFQIILSVCYFSFSFQDNGDTHICHLSQYQLLLKSGPMSGTHPTIVSTQALDLITSVLQLTDYSICLFILLTPFIDVFFKI